MMTPGIARARRRIGTRRRGFMLVAVLWIVALVAAAGMQAAVLAREGTETAHFRIEHTRAYWHAFACLERMRATLDATLLHAGDAADARLAWAGADAAIAHSIEASCGIVVRAAGSGIDINRASHAGLLRALVLLGAEPLQADSLAAAIVDWRRSSGGGDEHAGVQRAPGDGGARVYAEPLV